jgi:hypothetical protein
VAAARAVSNQITHAFGSLTQTGAIASSVSNLSKIFSNLAGVFTSLDRAANSAKNVGPDLAVVSAGLKTLAAAAGGGGGFVSSLNEVSKAFAHLGGSKDISTLTTELNGLGKMFDSFGRLAKSSASITQQSMSEITGALLTLDGGAKQIVPDVQAVVLAFANMDTKKAQTDLNNLQTALNKVGQVFQAVGTISQNSGGITAQSMGNIVTSLQTFNDYLPYVMAELDKTKSDFDKFHDFKALFGDLNNLMVLFGKVSQVFQAIGQAAQNSSAATGPALGNIVTSLGNVAKALQQLGGAIIAANGPLTSLLSGLIGNMEGVVNSPAVHASFENAGYSMMQGMTAGINAAAGAVGTAAAAAATNALGAARSATKAQSPSLLFAQLGEDWMAGLVQGIHNQAHTVQAAVTGSVPVVNPAHLAPTTGGGVMNVTANFTINAPGGNPTAIKNAIEKDSATQFAKNALIAMRSGAGTTLI